MFASSADVQKRVEVSINDEARVDGSKSTFPEQFKGNASLNQELVILLIQVMADCALPSVRTALQQLVSHLVWLHHIPSVRE